MFSKFVVSCYTQYAQKKVKVIRQPTTNSNHMGMCCCFEDEDMKNAGLLKSRSKYCTTAVQRETKYMANREPIITKNGFLCFFV